MAELKPMLHERGRGRHRLQYAALAGATVGVGLVVHAVDLGLHPVARDMLGDALWAVMIFFGLAVLQPRTRLGARFLVALVICFAVEVTQLYHTPRWDAVRATQLGHLVLGSGFDPRDFLAYLLGVAIAAGWERTWWARGECGR
jgi:hypothetical protein